MYSVTIFKNQYDNRTHRRINFDAWQDFTNLLLKLSSVPGVKGGPNSASLISPAVYEAGAKRANDNVLGWAGWCAVDVDELHIHSQQERQQGITDNEQQVLDKLRNKISEVVGDYQCVCYSTASSTIEQPKFRLVFPLTQGVHHDDIPHLWFALNSEIEGMADKQTKDLSRMFYVPAQYPNAFNFFFEHQGSQVLDPKTIMKKWPYVQPTGMSFIDRLPKELQDQILQHRKDQMTNTNISWTSYHDCPFWPKKAANEYKLITDTGWYAKMYSIMLSIAFRAIENQYPISSHEIAQLCAQFDADTGNWYNKRPLKKEADRAIEYVYRHSNIT